MSFQCLVGPLVNRFGPRWVGFRASIFGSVGPLLSLWYSSVASLFWTIGVWIGVGSGVAYLPCLSYLSYPSYLPCFINLSE